MWNPARPFRLMVSMTSTMTGTRVNSTKKRARIAVRVWLVLISLWATGFAQEALYKLPDGLVSRSGGAVTVRGPTGDLSYVEGLGWSSGLTLDPLVVVGDEVYGSDALLQFLGIASPRLAGVRFGGSGTVRVVFDLQGLSAPLELVGQGRLQAGATLRLTLPELLLPLELPDPYRGVAVEVTGGPTTTVEVTGPEAFYSVFSLETPSRLVLDITPVAQSDVRDETRVLRPGVTWRTFSAPTAVGSSAVQLLEIAPTAGEFRVVGSAETPSTVSNLADGAFAAINAGYFDTRTFDAIGLLKVDYGLLSLPSRSRASVGFGLGGTVIDRVDAKVNVRLNGRRVVGVSSAASEVSVHTAAGTRVGLPTDGVVTVSGGRVVANRTGPQTVPPQGFALVYEPGLRELALADAGDTASYEVDFSPQSFGAVRYAVEAGPLLVAAGRPAFDPEAEAFERGERILDVYTQQAAIGVRADGTVLLVAADNMVAEELVPLFLALGATAAMRLDSGSSTTLVVEGRVLNRASERKVVSAIVFVPYAN